MTLELTARGVVSTGLGCMRSRMLNICTRPHVSTQLHPLSLLSVTSGMAVRACERRAHPLSPLPFLLAQNSQDAYSHARARDLRIFPRKRGCRVEGGVVECDEGKAVWRAWVLGSTGHGLAYGWWWSSARLHAFRHAKVTCEPSY